MLKRSYVFVLALALAACAAPQRAQPPLPAQVSLPPAPPPGEPPELVGLQEGQLRAAFGSPAFIRKDGAVQMWRYDSASCKAFFFLYPASNALAVRHIETLPRGTSMAADAACLAALRNRPLTPVS